MHVTAEKKVLFKILVVFVLAMEKKFRLLSHLNNRKE
jgi:hypothetical protein